MSQPDEETAKLLLDCRAVLLEMDQHGIETGGKQEAWKNLVNGMQRIHLATAAHRGRPCRDHGIDPRPERDREVVAGDQRSVVG
jgi:hypothetical protein